MKNKILKILSLMMVFSMLVPTSVLGNPSDPPKITVLESDVTVKEFPDQSSLDLGAAYQTPDGRVSLIVELQSFPLGLAAKTQGQKLDIESLPNQNYLADLKAEQDAVISEIAAMVPSVEIGLRYGAVFNGLNLLVHPEDAERPPQAGFR